METLNPGGCLGLRDRYAVTMKEVMIMQSALRLISAATCMWRAFDKRTQLCEFCWQVFSESVLPYPKVMSLKPFLMLTLIGFTLRASAQSFNIDLDVGSGSANVGNGTPSSMFGGAAGQIGFWNRIDSATHTSQWTLLGLDGSTSAARMTNTFTGGGGGSGWIGNTGDHRLLMNDYTRITIPCTFTFSNLLPGRYEVVTYGSDPSNFVIPLEVRVPGAVIETKRSGQALMPGNQFIEGVTHTIHEVMLTGSTLQLILSDPLEGWPAPSVNGFQLAYTPVPEPAACATFGIGLFWLLRVRRT